MAPEGTAEMSIDYYELLAIPASASESEIRRAYRKTSLLYHPDKVKPTPETLDKFQLLQTALNILTDTDEKTKYDQTREARLRRIAENAALESRRRKMKEDLEQREGGSGFAAPFVNGSKRTWSQRDLEIKRIAEENRKRRDAASLQRTQAREQALAAEEKKEAEKPLDSMDRSVRVRWIREGEGLEIDQAFLEQAFPAGEVESVVMLKSKKRRIEGRDKKVEMGTAVVVFASLIVAKKVMARGPWEGVESVDWMGDRERDPT